MWWIIALLVLAGVLSGLWIEVFWPAIERKLKRWVRRARIRVIIKSTGPLDKNVQFTVYRPKVIEAENGTPYSPLPICPNYRLKPLRIDLILKSK